MPAAFLLSHGFLSDLHWGTICLNNRWRWRPTTIIPVDGAQSNAAATPRLSRPAPTPRRSRAAGIKKTNSAFTSTRDERRRRCRRTASLWLVRHLLAPLKDGRTADAQNLICALPTQTDYSAVFQRLASALTFMFFNVSLALSAPILCPLLFNHTLGRSSHLSFRTLSHQDGMSFFKPIILKNKKRNTF